jgi:hypothetical protein
LLKRLVLALIACTFFLGLLSPYSLRAQRTFEADGRVVYEDAQGKRTDLGIGFSPVLISDGRLALLRGRKFGYGEDFDCANKGSRNWVAVYDPTVTSERVVFDGIVPSDTRNINYCIFDQMQMSHDASLLYLVIPAYATSGSLAIISLPKTKITYIPGVCELYVIKTGPHRDELIYVRRVYHKGADGNEYPAYPFIHARADGHPIREVSDEWGGQNNMAHDKMPLLRNYLQRIGGTINVNGETLP